MYTHHISIIMPKFDVSVTIENKLGISDPEGDTILKDLVLKSNTHNGSGGGIISAIRTARMLRFTIDVKNSETAKTEIGKICDELRIYNPLVSKVTIDVL